jgi:hypothetical protein
LNGTKYVSKRETPLKGDGLPEPLIPSFPTCAAPFTTASSIDIVTKGGVFPIEQGCKTHVLLQRKRREGDLLDVASAESTHRSRSGKQCFTCKCSKQAGCSSALKLMTCFVSFLTAGHALEHLRVIRVTQKKHNV